MRPARPAARESTRSAARAKNLPWGEEQRGIEIALDGDVADAGPRLVERSPPIDANHVAPGLAAA